MVKKGLSNNEKLVLASMVRDPLLTDRERGEQLGISGNTTATIRKRLLANDYLRFVYLPNPNFMGCELIAVIYSEFNPGITDEKRIDVTSSVIDSVPEIFLSIGEGHQGFSLSLAKNYTDIARVNNERINLYASHRFIENVPPTMVIFPNDLSSIDSFFDYFPLLNRELGTELPARSRERVKLDRRISELSKNEQAAYTELIKHPGETDETVSRDLPVSRKTVSNCRRRFVSGGYMEPVYIPNLYALGIAIMAMIHTRFNPRNPCDPGSKDRKPIVHDSAFFSIAGMYDQFTLSAHKSYEVYQEELNQMVQEYKARDMLQDIPAARIYTTTKMKIIKDLSFVPNVEKMIGLAKKSQ